jgi:hypothetical protein
VGSVLRGDVPTLAACRRRSETDWDVSTVTAAGGRSGGRPVFLGRPRVHIGRPLVLYGRGSVFLGRGSVFFGRPLSPKRRGVSPKRRPLSQDGRGVSPKRRRLVHIVRGVSPYKPEIPPKRRGACPQKGEALPEGRTTFPRRRVVPRLPRAAPLPNLIAVPLPSSGRQTGASARYGSGGSSTRIASPGRTSPPLRTIPMMPDLRTRLPCSSRSRTADIRPVWK